MKRRTRSVLLGLMLLAPLPQSVRAGVLDAPLPVFPPVPPAAVGRQAVLVAVMPAIANANGIHPIIMCTNVGTSTTTVDIGVEVFDAGGVRRNTIGNGNGAVLDRAKGATATIAVGATAVIHEDALIVLEPATA